MLHIYLVCHRSRRRDVGRTFFGLLLLWGGFKEIEDEAGREALGSHSSDLEEVPASSQIFPRQLSALQLPHAVGFVPGGHSWRISESLAFSPFVAILRTHATRQQAVSPSCVKLLGRTLVENKRA